MSAVALKPLKRIDYVAGVNAGLPRDPRRGQTFETKNLVYVWYGPDGTEPGMGDLGFWGVFTKIVGAVTGIGGLFGGKGDKKTQQLLENQQAQLSE